MVVSLLRQKQLLVLCLALISAVAYADIWEERRGMYCCFVLSTPPPTPTLHTTTEQFSSLTRFKSVSNLVKHPQTTYIDAVKNAFVHAYNGYREYAWGYDDLKPVSKTGMNFIGLQSTLVSCLDTMHLMGLDEEYTTAREAVASGFHGGTSDGVVSVFESSIRIIGGFLGIYHLTKDEMYIEKAEIVAASLLPAFNTPSGLPRKFVNLKSGKTDDSYTYISLAEAGTLQLEWRYLSHLTGNDTYREKTDHVLRVLLRNGKTGSKLGAGLKPTLWNVETGEPPVEDHTTLTIGAGADSYYEYLLKLYLQGKSQDTELLHAFESALLGVSNIAQETVPNGLVYAGNIKVKGTHDRYFHHLACFMGAVAALYENEVPASVRRKGSARHVNSTFLAAGITDGCYNMYHRSPTGLSPEAIIYLTEESEGGLTPANGKPNDFEIRSWNYELRPEAIESIFYMYYYTKDEKYREYAWEMFEAITQHAQVDNGFSTVHNISSTGNENDYGDRQHSFFFSETLKYFYLIFSEPGYKGFNLSEVVFTTEAHAIPLFEAKLTHEPSNGGGDGDVIQRLVIALMLILAVASCGLLVQRCRKLYHDEELSRRNAVRELEDEIELQFSVDSHRPYHVYRPTIDEDELDNIGSKEGKTTGVNALLDRALPPSSRPNSGSSSGQAVPSSAYAVVSDDDLSDSDDNTLMPSHSGNASDSLLSSQ